MEYRPREFGCGKKHSLELTIFLAKAEQRSLLSPSVGSCDALHIKVIALSCCGWRPLTTGDAHSRAATQLTTLSPIDSANLSFQLGRSSASTMARRSA